MQMSSTDDKKVTFEDVAGLKEEKEEDLEEVVDFLKAPKKYIQVGASDSERSSPCGTSWNR